MMYVVSQVLTHQGHRCVFDLKTAHMSRAGDAWVHRLLLTAAVQ